MCLSLAADALCCAGSTVCSGCCLCCKSICGSTFKQQVKLTYIIIQVIAMVFTIVVLYYAADILNVFKEYIHCSQDTGGDFVCLGVSSVYRMSLALAIMHFFILLACFTRSEFAKGVNEGCWMLKILIVFALWILFFFVPNSFIEGYSDFAKFIGGLFLLFQIIMIVDLCYMLGEKWKNNYEEGQRIYGGLLIFFTSIAYIGNLIFNIFMFIWFAPESSCGLNIFLIVFNIILILILIILTISGIAKNGSLLTSGIYSGYISYLLWSGLAGNPDKQCNNLFFSESVMITGIVMGFLLMIVSLSYMTFNTSKNSSRKIYMGRNFDLNSNILQDDGKKDEESVPHHELIENNMEEGENSLKNYKNNMYIAFHIIMVICSIYVSMMLTNWGSPKINDTSMNKFLPSLTSYWIQIIASWVAILVYIWTILAQKIFSDREFRGEEE